MKNLKMGTKLALAFGFMIALSIILGGMSIMIMMMVKDNAVMLSEEYIPEVKICTDIERHALETIAFMGHYNLTEYFTPAKKSFLEIKADMVDANALVDQSPQLLHRKKNLDKIQSYLTDYEPMIAEAEDVDKSMLQDAKGMEKDAEVYMNACYGVLSSLRQSAPEGGSTGNSAAAQEAQIKKIYMINDVIDIANIIRLTNFKAQAQRNEAMLKDVLNKFDDLSKKTDELKTVLEAEKYGTQIQEIQKSAANYQAAIKKLDESWTKMENLRVKRDALAKNVLEEVRMLANAGMDNTISISKKAVERLSATSQIIVIGLAVIVILGIIMAFYLTSIIAAPLRQGVVFAQKLAAGDFTQTLAINRRDEIGILASALNETVTSLRRQILETIKAVNVIATSTSEISTSVSQVATGSIETATAVSETTTTLEEVKQTSIVTSEKVKAVSESATHAAQTSQAGKQSTDATLDCMNRIRQQMESIAGSIVRLSEQSQSIGEIIASVDDIAEQSNLLAVNASIEAAKAGEYGKGFGVVAQEIKSLAEQSRQATQKVRSILFDIQKATSAAVMATEQGTKAVESGVKQSSQTGEAISVLAGQLQEASHVSIHIAASNQQQLAGVGQVAMAMENIKTASEQNVESMEQLKTATGNLQEQGAKLKELVDLYKV